MTLQEDEVGADVRGHGASRRVDLTALGAGEAPSIEKRAPADDSEGRWTPGRRRPWFGRGGPRHRALPTPFCAL